MYDLTYSKIEELSLQGNRLAENGFYDEAISKFQEALDLVPIPKTDWEASLWLLTGIGDMYFSKNQFSEAAKYFYDALNYTEAIDNPYINLRLGESLYEIKDYSKSKEFLLRAFMIDGKAIFEEEDSKYFNFIKDII